MKPWYPKEVTCRAGRRRDRHAGAGASTFPTAASRWATPSADIWTEAEGSPGLKPGGSVLEFPTGLPQTLPVTSTAGTRSAIDHEATSGTSHLGRHCRAGCLSRSPASPLTRGEPINSLWLVVAAVGTYLIGYRFYAKWIAAKVMALDDRAPRRPSGCATATTSSRRTSGSSSAITSRPSRDPARSSARRWPRSSATCPARSGSSSAPSLGGLRAGLRDPLRLDAPRRQVARPDGARRRSARVGGFTALVTVLLIMIILLAVVALVVVNALATARGARSRSPRRCPSRVLMGLYLRYWRPGKVLEVLGASASCCSSRASSAGRPCRNRRPWRRSSRSAA